MNIAYITIGRNVGSVPMASEVWADFVADVRHAATSTIGAPNMIIKGEGGSWEGVAEESAVFVILDASEIVTVRLALRRRLANLATTYAQDAIAVAFGTSSLVVRSDALVTV